MIQKICNPLIIEFCSVPHGSVIDGKYVLHLWDVS
jgi:hypothetical protein